MKYTTVKNLKWTNEKKESLQCDVTFEGLGELPFHATPDDSESHGREIYNRCIAGEFGNIEEFVPVFISSTIIDNEKDLPPTIEDELMK